MINFENLTKDQLWSLRQQVVVNSIYVEDYSNDFGYSPSDMYAFFDGYYDYLCELGEELGCTHDEIMQLDDAENLYSWYNCYDNFDWVEYVEEK